LAIIFSINFTAYFAFGVLINYKKKEKYFF
jgi:hypothetical protein